jgi:hypothetical protein
MGKPDFLVLPYPTANGARAEPKKMALLLKSCANPSRRFLGDGVGAEAPKL